MEEQWLAYLRENNPELYEQAVSSVKWTAEWRDKELAAANARVAELEATLKEIAKGNIVYPDLFAQQSLKDTKNSGCPYGVQPSKRCCKVCNELENILFKCNQEIVKQACKTEQLQQQLVAANQRAEQAEAKLNETYTDEHGTVWTVPTAWAYAAVCKANDRKRDALREIKKECVENLDGRPAFGVILDLVETALEGTHESKSNIP